MNEYKFFVNEEKGVVVATIKRKELSRLVWRMSMRKICRGFDCGGDEWQWGSLADAVATTYEKWFDKKYKFNVLTATARCNFDAGDVFDEEIGRFIAEDKLDIKVANIAREFCFYMYNQAHAFANQIAVKSYNISDFINKTEANLYELGD